ncbi:hypothetical protein [Dendronalium phyllosphericum]|nr:hypothetical protein [Dendronalium phyllosphericum]
MLPPGLFLFGGKVPDNITALAFSDAKLPGAIASALRNTSTP